MPQPVRTRNRADGARAAWRLLAELRTRAAQLIVIRDPATGAAVHQQPHSRQTVINPNGQALLNVFPLPNALDRSITGGNYNYQFQESLEVPRHQHLVRIDFRPDAEGRALRPVLDVVRRQPGVRGAGGRRELGAARPALHVQGRQPDPATTHGSISSTLVNELSVGYRHSTEAGSALERGRAQRRHARAHRLHARPVHAVDQPARASSRRRPSPARFRIRRRSRSKAVFRSRAPTRS